MEKKKTLVDFEKARKNVLDILKGKVTTVTAVMVSTAMQKASVDAVEVKCKVGDWVYALWEAPVKEKYIIYCAEVKEIRISNRFCRLTTTYILEPVEYRGHRKEYFDSDFGELVFLSCEEAKAALAKTDGERKEGE